MTLAGGGTPDSAHSSSLEDFFENGTVGLHLVGKDGTILRANRADYEPLGYTAEEYVGRNIAEFHADEATIGDILERLSRGESLDKYHARLKARDGSIRHVLISSNVCFNSGEFINTRCFTIDVTEKLAAEEALRETKERLAATYEGVLAGIAEADEHGWFLRVNEAFCQISGYSREELLKRRLFDLTHPDDLAEERRQYGRQVEGEIDRYATEKRYVRADGQIIWVEVSSSTVRKPDRRFGYGVRMVQDVTARKEAENRQKLLVDELNHRVKNTLATVQALATQTARRCTSAAEFRTRFEPRLLALSAAHDRLTRRNWEGASLSEIAREELGAHAAPGRTLKHEGPDVMLSPRASLSLSMALHELATNAVKHGALSVPGGRVDLRWEVERKGPFPCSVKLSWAESGGPPPRTDVTKGFGSRLLRVTAEELKGTMDTDLCQEGYRWSLSFPLTRPQGAA